jgi:hypothetical protein
VFPRIARQVPSSQFAFIDLPNSLRAKFRRRLELAFAAEGLRAETVGRPVLRSAPPVRRLP